MYLATKPSNLADHIGDGAVIGGDNLAQLLGIEPCRKRGRADEIAEHHGQLAPLGFDCGRMRPRLAQSVSW